LIAAAAFYYLTLIQTFQLYVEVVFCSGHNRFPGLRLSCKSAEEVALLGEGAISRYDP